MKDKLALEALRTQLHSSLKIFSDFSSTEDILIEYQLEENDSINITVDEKQIKAYGLLLVVNQTFNGELKTRRLWLRRYPVVGSLNEVKYQAFKELFDIIIGNFLINASRTDDKTLEDLSNIKNEAVV